MLTPKEDETEEPATPDADEELLDEMFTDRSDKSDDPTISVDFSNERGASCPESGSNSMPTTRSAIETLPVLSRVISHDAYFENPLHTVGRTRVPWHSKSVSDLRDPATKPPRIVAFDVGGKLFRCKESLIAKYPLKRLNQIITCGCGKISCLDDAFFIDRNPQHFEMILDWYRTGKLVRQRNVDEEAFKDDAIYFDLYDELFPATPAASATAETSVPWETSKVSPGLPARRRSVNDVDSTVKSNKRVSMFASMTVSTKQIGAPSKALQPPSKSKHQKTQDTEKPVVKEDGPLRFFRRERRVLTTKSIPQVFKVRKFEQLLVESVKGRGKLMVRVCDVTGMQSVEVPEAVLFDSHSRFYLEGARAQLDYNALLPGDHMYTFWMEEHSNVSSVQSSAPASLDIEFKLLFTFDHSDRLTSAIETELTRSLSDSNTALDALTPQPTPKSTPTTDSFSPCLFLPPSQIQHAPEGQSKRLSPLAKAKHSVKRGNQRESPMRNAGASIVRGQQPRPRPEEGKITFYRPNELELDPATDQDTLLSLHKSSERRSLNQAVETAYQDMQPRLFP